MSPHYEQVLVVDPALRGIRLAEFLELQLPAARRVELRALLSSGQVRVNGESILTNRRLRSGDVVEVAEITAAGERPSPAPARVLPPVLFESATCLVVDKPAGMPTVPDRGNDPGLHGLLAELRPGADLRIVHRLDRDTSGCLLLAKGLEAARHFDAELRAFGFQKQYRALVPGIVGAAEFEIDLWLGPDPKRPGKVVARSDAARGFRAAATRVGLSRAFSRHSLLDLWPLTGRGHQLRVHLAAIGHPIVGDADYGGPPLLLSELKRGYKPRLGFPERPLLERMFLHAMALGFRDVDGSAIAVDAAMPQDLTLAVSKLERFASRTE